MYVIMCGFCMGGALGCWGRDVGGDGRQDVYIYSIYIYVYIYIYMIQRDNYKTVRRLTL